MAPRSEPYRVAVIGRTGRGNYGHGMDLVWGQFKDRCEVVAVADAEEKRRAEAAKRVEHAVADVLADGRRRTPEIGGTSSTVEVTDAVLEKLGA